LDYCGEGDAEGAGGADATLDFAARLLAAAGGAGHSSNSINSLSLLLLAHALHTRRGEIMMLRMGASGGVPYGSMHSRG